MTNISVVKNFFIDNYPYIYLSDIPDKDIIEFLNKPYIIKKPLIQQMNSLYDYVTSQDLVDIQE